MNIRMVHPVHGPTVVYDEAEMTRHAALGWVADGYTREPEPALETPTSAPQSETEPAKRKPGRPRKVQ